MTQTSLVRTLTELVEPLAHSLGLALWGIELTFGGRSLVRIFVEDASTGSSSVPAGPSSPHSIDHTSAAADAPAQAADTPLAGPAYDALTEDAFDGVSEDSPRGVTIAQCAELSRLLGLALEVEDLIPGAYVLEVSSPGLDRTFFTPEQLSGAKGHTVEITLLEPADDFPGRRRFRGELVDVPVAAEAADGAFLLRTEDTVLPGEDAPLLKFRFADVKKAKQVHVAPEKPLPGKGKKKGKAKSPA